MALNDKQINAVIMLDGPQRYSHFIKQVVDADEVWGLYKDGWALASTSDGTQVFPVWPAEEYAALCIQDQWAEYEPSSISLEGFMEELLPMLKQDGILPGVFYTPTNKGITPEISQILEDLHKELEKYE